MPAESREQIQIAKPSVGDEEWYALREPIRSGWLTQGKKVAEFERAFAQRHATKHAIATSSCTTALHLSLVALDIGPGDEVIVPAFTWVATANVVLYCGAIPVLVDIDPITYNIDPEQVAAAITPKTKAIIPVHLFGLCADMDRIATIAGTIPVVEDAACAAGAAYKGRPAGSLGRLGCFSFHPRKVMTTGEGGMITTNDDELAERLNRLRNHGASLSEEARHQGPRPYLMAEYNILGFNYRMTDLQGAMGIEQLKKLDAFLTERQQWANFYRQELAGLAWLRTPVAPDDGWHSWQAYVCFVDPSKSPMPRDDLMRYLDQRGIGVRPGTHAVHMLGYYQTRFRLRPDQFPAAEACHHCTISLPLHNQMTERQYRTVVEKLKAVT